MLTPKEKEKIIKKFKIHKTDTGSPEIQAALLTKELEDLSKHLKKHSKDHAGRRGLLGMVSQRRRLLTYLEREYPKRHKALVKKLGLSRKSGTKSK